QRRPRPRPPDQAPQDAGRERLGGGGAERGQEPRGPPHAGPARAQGHAPAPRRHRPGPPRPPAARQGAATQARGTGPPAPHPRPGRTAGRAPGGLAPTGAAPDMTGLVHAAVEVRENVTLARQTYCVRLHTPELARAIRPGQFLMIRLPGHTDPLLGRPFALYDTALDEHGRPVAVDVVYLVVGKVTGLLAEVRPGDRVDVWGPL